MLHRLKSLNGFDKKPFSIMFRLFIWRLTTFAKRWPKIRVSEWPGIWTVPPVWTGAGGSMFYLVREEYEPELKFLGQVVKDGDVFIDGGANVGLFTVRAAGLVGNSGVVVSFEPGELAAQSIERNIQLNSFSNVKLVRKALGSGRGTARLYHNFGNARNFSFSPLSKKDGFEEVDVETLDDLYRDGLYGRVDVIKLDVEGAEEFVFNGAKNIVNKFKPIVIFEINPKMIEALGLSKFGASDFLKARGYKFYEFNACGNIKPFDLVGEWKGSANLLAIHPQNSRNLTAQ